MRIIILQKQLETVKTELISKLIVLYIHINNAYILYFSRMGPDENMALNMNDKNISYSNITYE